MDYRDTGILYCHVQEEDKDGDDLEIDYSFFDERLWPVIAERVPAFEALKVGDLCIGKRRKQSMILSVIYC